MSGFAGASEPDQFDAIREEIQRRLVQQSVPSVSVAVARGDRILWEEGFGWADRENRVRIISAREASRRERRDYEDGNFP